MMIHEITEKVGKYKTRKRIGRGHGSGSGKTSGRGHKGAKSRAGFSRRAGFEGGQMPFARRIPKRGFTNSQFRNDFHIVNLATLEARLDDGAEVTLEVLVEMGILRDTKHPLKVLGEGDLTKKFTVTAGKASASAREKIEKAGGTLTLEPRVKWTRAAAAAAAADAPAKSTKGRGRRGAIARASAAAKDGDAS